MIHVREITKIYGKTLAIRDVSFQVERGEILGLLGPNGAGKTTTIRILTCHTPPTSGTATVAGFDVGTQSLEVRRRIGYMPETAGLYEDMTVSSFLNFTAEIKGLDRTRQKKCVGAVLDRLNLESVSHRLIRNLSRGYRQRVGLAQALVADPEVLILDEPTVGLDPAQIREIRSLVTSMAGEKTVILSTHILPEVAAVCSRIAIINLGRIAAVGSPGELSRKYAPESRIAVLADGERELLQRALENIRGVVRVALQENAIRQKGLLFHLDIESPGDIRDMIPATVQETGGRLLEVYSMGATLEEVYMKAIMGEKEDVVSRLQA